MTVPTPSYQSSPALAFPIPPKKTPVGFSGMGQDETGTQVNLPIGWFGTEPGAVPSTTTSAAGGGGFWDFLSQQVQSWSKAGQQILVGQNIPRGVYTQKDKYGNVITYVQPSGPQPSIVSGTVGGPTLTAAATPGAGLILVGGAALLLVLMMARR